MPTVGEALAAFRHGHHLDPDPVNARTWTCGIGPITLRLPNFAWRRAAIRQHDLHHIITAYPCTLRGEFQMAAWEFAAGRFPHPGATLFCLPLVVAGLAWSPRAIWTAFRRGRRASGLYGVELTDSVLCAPLPTLLERVGLERVGLERVGRERRVRGDVLAFALLVLSALATVLIPIA
jgi:hypothetical protein